MCRTQMRAKVPRCHERFSSLVVSRPVLWGTQSRPKLNMEAQTALSAAVAAVESGEEGEALDGAIRTLAHALGAKRVEVGTTRAIRAVLHQHVHPDRYPRDEDAATAHNAKERNFRKWKHEIQSVFDCALDFLPVQELEELESSVAEVSDDHPPRVLMARGQAEDLADAVAALDEADEVPMMAFAMMAVCVPRASHSAQTGLQYTCDGCACALLNRRWHCVSCADIPGYDLCEACHAVEPGPHMPGHVLALFERRGGATSWLLSDDRPEQRQRGSRRERPSRSHLCERCHLQYESAYRGRHPVCQACRRVKQESN